MHRVVFPCFVAALLLGQQAGTVLGQCNPALIASVEGPGLAHDVAVSGNHAFVLFNNHSGAAAPGTMLVIEISNPAAPAVVGAWSEPGTSFYGVAVADGRAYVTRHDSSMTVLDVSNPADPTAIGQVALPSHGYEVVLSGQIAFVHSHGGEINAIDVSVPTAPVILGSRFVDPGLNVTLIPAGNTLFAMGNRANQFDVTNPANMTLVAQSQQLQTFGSADLRGDGTLLGARIVPGNQIVRVTNPVTFFVQYSGPTASPLGPLPNSVRTFRFAGTGDRAVVYGSGSSSGTGTVAVLDVSNLPSWTMIGRVDGLGGFGGNGWGDMTIRGDYAYVADGGQLGNAYPNWTIATPGALRVIRLSGCIPSTNAAPTAVAGADVSIRAGDVVNLDGSASFDDNTQSQDLLYSWSFHSKPGASAAILVNANTPTPSFVADVAGTYVVSLVVTDGGALSSATDYVEISSANLAPTAAATVDFSLAIIGHPARFDGAGSTDPEDDALTFAWAITSAPSGSAAALVGASSAAAFLTPDLPGDYAITLTVSDFLGTGAPTTVVITAATASSFAQAQIIHACDLVESLRLGQVKTKGNQQAFCNFLRQAIGHLNEGNVNGALDKLAKARDRTDGCILRGAPDGNGPRMDWITDCGAQAGVYCFIQAAMNALQ